MNEARATLRAKAEAARTWHWGEALPSVGFAIRGPTAAVRDYLALVPPAVVLDILKDLGAAEARVTELEMALVESAGFRVEYEDLDDIEQDDYDEHCAKVRALVGHLAP